jgi:hydroxymethylglutaryl-CoA synthase
MAFQGLENIKNEIGAVFIGSETFPYAVKPSSAALAEWLSLSNRYVAYDTQFACKAATGAVISAIGMVKSGDIQYGLVCGSNKANARPQDALEYSAGSGANAWIIGQENVILEVLGWSSYTSDTPDFWRRSKEDYPSHAGRFTGGPAYFRHITEASTDLMSKLNVKPTDCTYGVFHMPNGSFPLKVGKSLGFTQKQLEPSYVVPMLGNSYSASALMGLASTLDVANPGDTIFFASYGSGSGSDAIVFQVTDAIVKRRKAFKKSIEKKTYINYATYMRFMNIIS